MSALGVASPVGWLSTSSAPSSVIPPSVPDSGSSGSDNSGWLSGLGDLFSGIGNAVASGLRASNAPSTPTAGSGWVYNPATAQYYNPVTGQALTSTGTLSSAALGGSSGSIVWILLLAVVAFLLFRRRG